MAEEKRRGYPIRQEALLNEIRRPVTKERSSEQQAGRSSRAVNAVSYFI